MSFPSFESLEPWLDATDPTAWSFLTTQFPLYPLESEGMPLPGPDFMREAQYMGDTIGFDGKGKSRQLTGLGRRLLYMYLQALYDPDFSLTCEFRGNVMPAKFVCGHPLGKDSHGPVPSRVMVIGKHPGIAEVTRGVNFIGQSADAFWQAIREFAIPDEEIVDWYITNLVRYDRIDPGGSKLPADSIKNCIPLLHQELRIVRPDYILCFGSEASAELLGKGHTVSDMFGRSIDYKIPIHYPWEEPAYHVAKLMVVMHPAAVYHNPAKFDEYRDSFKLFYELVNGAIIGQVETDIDHREIEDVETLTAVVDELIAEGQNDFAVDAEWHMEYPQAPGAYLRTIQFSGKEKQAFLINLRAAGGRPVFRPNLQAALPQLKRLLKSTAERPVTVGGHFFRADLPWLIHYGLDLRAEYATVPHSETEAGWSRMSRGEGGWDTSLMLHAIMETGPFGLEHHTSRLCGVPRYDVAMEQWKREFCRVHKMELADLDGYGEAPAQILNPYGLYDADATFRLKKKLERMLDCDQYGNNSWRPCWQAHRASPGFLEMEMVGLAVDREKADLLTADYMKALEDHINRFRVAIRWPDFNSSSPFKVRELLFGEELSGMRDKETNAVKIQRPRGATCLHLTPVKTTGKPSKDWAKVVARGETHLHMASTDRETMGILVHQADEEASKVVYDLRDIKYLQQVLRSVLRPPVTNEDDEIVTDDDGFNAYEKGFISWRRTTGRVHTRLSQNKETGRAASARPPTQNFGKRREDDYKRILGDHYRYPLRSVICAGPGKVLIEADIKLAELAGLAWLSDDKQFIEDVNRSMLPSSDPNYLDMHADRAVSAFGLSCPPTKKGLESIGKPGLRVAAKAVNFGVPYGRTADAIVRQCREEGAIITLAEGQALIDGYYGRYANTALYLRECRTRSQSPGWIIGALGRYRRFAPTSDQKVIGDQERQACNFPIQNLVADYISEVVAQLQEHRFETGIPFNLLLQIHDALLFEVEEQYVKVMVEEVIPECMTNRLPIYPVGLDGSPRAGGPYRFGVDVEIYRNWGIPLEGEELAALGV